MSSPTRGLKIKIKRMADVADASHSSEVPAGTNSTNNQQPTSGTEPSEALDQVRLGLVVTLQLTHSL